MLWRVCLVVGALFGLGACEQVSSQLTEGLARLGAPADATGEGIRTLAVLNGDARVRGPEGYCIDQSASTARRGFAVMAGCALLASDADIMPTIDGLITVQFGATDTASVAGNETAFAEFLKSDAGRSILAGDGDVASLSAVETIEDRGAVLVRFEDTSGASFPGTSGPQWRGFMDIGDRLVTVSVQSFERNPLGRPEAERLLVVAMAELAEVNAPVAEQGTGAAENG